MSVFLSKNNTEPYDIIDDINSFIVEAYMFENDVIYYSGGQNSGDNSIIEKTGSFYLIFTDGSYTNVKVTVSNVYDTGVDLLISKTDLLGNPEGYSHEIVIGDVDATTNVQKYLLMYKWYILNNIYINKIGHKIATVTVTSD